MEADKLKKKLNGSVLKGTKVRIEEAKPEKKRKVEPEEHEDERKARKKAKKEKRRKREEGVLSGHQLEEGRRIKRGWKEDGLDKKSSKKAKKSKISKHDGDEGLEGKKLRFKTSIPPNVAPVEDKSKKKSKGKKEKKGKGNDVVEEFKKTQKPMITAVGSGKQTASFEEGKGWVDDEGNVIEAAPVSKHSKASKRSKSSSESFNVEATKKDATAPVAELELANGAVSRDDGTSSESSILSESSELDSSDSDDEVSVASESPVSQEDEASKRTPEPQPKEVHPLEALFKRPGSSSASKPKPHPIDTSFSFFNAGSDDVEGEGENDKAALPPQTPHTKQDLEWRSVRSAAPTPDTAAIGKKFSFPFAQDVEADENADSDQDDVGDTVAGAKDAMEVDATPSAKAGDQDEKQESDFRKWFFENRGDLNRGWKKRRREERKAKRQRENRRLSRRVV